MPEPKPNHRKFADFITNVSALASAYFLVRFVLDFSIETLIENENLLWFFIFAFITAVYGFIYGKTAKNDIVNN
ncbi:hypothetical protein EM98_023705 [Vibrio parahaemolyticus]|nr:hypothetical protein EM98_023705 [Vibrio parahaemolyticus]